MNRLIHQVISWAEETNLVHGSDLKTETLKLVVEFGRIAELSYKIDDCCDGIGKCIAEMVIICRMKNVSLNECLEHTQEISDVRIKNLQYVLILMAKYLGNLANNIVMNEDIHINMGYFLIYLTALTRILHYSPGKCLSMAYNELKKRKGIIFDGTFIKETDEKYQNAVAILKRRNPKT
ncbi:MazG-like family protein [Nitrosomonas sp. Nm166]|uniref:MazG-like family protein n=1 Tax=Nitrosomonas sp. Nm166 TaxID=1881054 RepID=UPI0008E79C1D|nr:MazG-like family protein [Nitrosomonas sp. Nm166]SFF10492.1 hypothetical protein SAMN05428977_105022 [Nitrosomonas sp. Nm166]